MKRDLSAEKRADVLRRLKGILSPRRFRHTLSVTRLARTLAGTHGEDPDRAAWAGLLHDCAKEMPPLRLSTIARLHRLPVPDKRFILRHRRFGLFHAHVSAWAARTRFRVRDRAVLSAIANHTLGADRMSRLDKILYIADFAAPDRGFAAGARVRRLARKDLDRAFREAVRLKLVYVLQTGGALHPQTVRLWNNTP